MITPKSALRWLLQIDRPVLARSDEEIAAEVARNYPWNLAVNLIEFSLFWFGSSFVSSTTILPLFVSKLTASPLAFGLVAVLAQGGWYLPQLLTANAVERLARKKPVSVNLGFFMERLPLWLLIVAALAARERPELALVLLLVGLTWQYLGAGLVATAWQELIASCFPVEKRGRFFGTAAFLGAGAGTLAAALSPWLLQNFAFPANFAVIFGIAAVFNIASWLFLALTREPVRPATAPRQSNRQFASSLPDLLARDHNFRRFLVARLVIAAAAMGTGFVTAAAVQRWHVADSTVGIYTVALLLGQTTANLAFGLLADRRGHKLVLELGALASCLAFALTWLSPWIEAYYAVYALLGVSSGAILVSGILVLMEFSEPSRRPTYAGIANSALGVVGMVSPLLGAALAGVDYGAVFAISAAGNLAAFALMRWWVREPRGLTRGEAA